MGGGSVDMVWVGGVGLGGLVDGGWRSTCLSCVYGVGTGGR